MPTSYASSYSSSSTSYWSAWQLYYPHTITGRSVNDSLSGYYGDDKLYGYGGHDYLFGNYGNDYLSGGEGNDRLDGGYGHDALKGDNGDDVLYGGAGDDMLMGDSSLASHVENQGNADVLYGGSGTDALFGGEGSDVLWGGTELDYLVGGSGSDIFSFRYGDSFAFRNSADIIVDWELNDLVVGARGGYAEFGADVSSIEDARWYANIYDDVGWLPPDTGNVFIYNSQTNTGYLLMDLDNDTYNTFESGVVINNAGNAWSMDGSHFVVA